MRALLGLLVLGGIFALAATWQSRRTAELRDRRAQRYGIPTAEAAESSEWSRLVLGRPSGAEPLAPREARVADEDAPESEWSPPTPAPDYRYTVRAGEILGTICQRHYGSARLELVRAVSAYNDLANPDDIREGQELLLPDEALLLPDGGR